MTLDVLFHLMKTISPEKNTAGENIHALITLLLSDSDRAEALSPFIHRLHLLAFAQSNPGNAEELLSAHLPKEDGILPLLDFADWPKVRYAASGEVQTRESQEYFRDMTSAANLLRTALIDAERVKGTPALYILDKLLSLNSALPERYKKMANIPYA
ncbi:TPA: hypothetical protein NDT49_004563 [Enterobacter asburiae]|uniref:Uncharacterized protein n=1 Tax=Enterobacter asburiae TaxID=61645 RepID=A0A8I1KHS3_ENTAS|nr:hypothetical protein [Enterobacter asburiae]EMB6148105.1 hypothetical protein [Enterobacter asburiae]MBJ6598889.1 hypothetical protein [Enterobacter asburiae]MBK4466163.1 hypothetical protein [Enterobacter asburiae]MBK4575651.1 hypothetical protein [Enterobacter asburiae]MCQ4369383.1 hypothetical protein [Enterobacter asburiae]